MRQRRRRTAGFGWPNMAAKLGIPDSKGRFRVPADHCHIPLRIIGGYLDGDVSVVRDNPEYRVALIAGEFVLVPAVWPPGSEAVEIAKMRILAGAPIAAGFDLWVENELVAAVRVAP